MTLHENGILLNACVHLLVWHFITALTVMPGGEGGKPGGHLVVLVLAAASRVYTTGDVSL